MKTQIANNTANNTAPSAPVVPKSEPNTEESLPFQSPNNTTEGNNAVTNSRPASLDLGKATKKNRLVTPLVIDSPDLQSMKTLNTPDLEKILLSSNLMQTPQPGSVFPAKTLSATSEQEAFGKGFEEALHSLHTSQSSQALLNNANANSTAAAGMNAITSTGMSGGSFSYSNAENYPIIKDEPLNSSTSPPLSPIDMETQEKIKLERKRQRNRVAASKCRKRKLERISKLEDKVKILKGENTDLAMVVKSLKDNVAQLKQQLIDHMDAGCAVPRITESAVQVQVK